MPENTAFIQMVLRWIHFVAGITWIGLLFFFNLVNIRFLKTLDPATRVKVFPALMKPALFWFRYSAFVTVFAGIWYWMTIVSADLRNARALHPEEHISGAMAIGGFFLIWTLAWFLCSLATMKGRLHILPILIVYAVIISIASYAYVSLNSNGWESNRLLCIGIGGGMGWVMIFNVWGIIWRNAKKLIRWTEQSAADGSAMPPAAAFLANENLVVSSANFALSLPMLFFMGAASHLPLFGL
ncbi:MAG TPA: urate hydroxylase PuuD [Terriglobales bacterium]|nr:urate hydroxylase PuuD [Terriglobales bacterium]